MWGSWKSRFWGTTALAAALSAWGAGVAAAQTAESPSDEIIVVTATRSAEEQFNVPATTTVITDEQIENQLASDIKDLVRFEPGVSVRASPSRFTAAFASTGRDGNSGFNIRGLEGNRVLFLVDGVRVPDAFSFGPASFGRGDYVDIDLLRSVEIVRGPASALYGSDGVAGVVSFVTRDPDDILGDAAFGGRARVGYAEADESWTATLALAGQNGPLQALLTYTRRDARELDTMGTNGAINSNRTEPNPQTIESNAAMARLVYAPSDTQRFRLTYEYGDRFIETEALAGRSVPPFVSTSVIDLDGIDESERERLAFDHQWDNEGGLIDRAQWSLYSQQSALRQFSAEDRNTAADRTRDTTFENDVWGANLQLDSEFVFGSMEHHFVYGGDYSMTRQEGIRTGTAPPAGETFPTRAFPNTDYALAGLFVQDQISLNDGRLLLYPSLRYDAYELEPEADALYPLVAEGQSDSRVTPRFGAVFWPAQYFGTFFNYAQGFKAPSPSQVNNNFSNSLLSYTSIANPNLEPETSESYEIGVRLRGVSFAGGQWRAQVSAFTATYEDFIDQVQVSGPPFGTGTPGNPSVFQVINLGDVEISGGEASLHGYWDNGFGFDLAYSIAEGDQIVRGARSPLQSVEPWKLVLGLGYDDPNNRYGGSLYVTHSAGKASEDACAGCFTPPDFTILDATAYWNITDAATFRVGAFNLTNQAHWYWGDVRGLAAVSTTRDAFTQPARNFSASIAYRF